MTDAQDISVGQILASARKKKRLRYKKLSSELNIDEIYLVALEEGNYDLIPGGEAYVKGFLRSYAKKLDLNPDDVIDNYLSSRKGSIKSKRKKRLYLKKLEKFVYNEFSDELRKLSRSQGRILVKLLNRQTGLTAHRIVSDYRNKFRALLYNTAASFYSISLKDKYEPFEDYEDYLIEDILQRSFSDGSLEKQDYALDFDLDELYVFWRDKK